MKVFNLCCDRDHSFEGWFASGDSFDSQLERGLVECPVCSSTTVRRMPSAPRLNLISGGVDAARAKASEAVALDPAKMQEAWMKVARYIQANTEDVGDRFVEEARRMHYEETPERAIRGKASSEEAKELADEGIEVFSFPMPKLPDGPLQ